MMSTAIFLFIENAHHQSQQVCLPGLQPPSQFDFRIGREVNPLYEDGATFPSPKLFRQSLIHHYCPVYLVFEDLPLLSILLLHAALSQNHSEMVGLVLNSLRRNKKTRSVSNKDVSCCRDYTKTLPGILTDTTINNRSCKRPYFLLLPSPIIMRKAGRDVEPLNLWFLDPSKRFMKDKIFQNRSPY